MLSVSSLPWMRHMLLREAVMQANAPAARALIEAGVDPFCNCGEMPFLAARTPSGGRDRAFPDYSDANAMIAMWLEARGAPNATGEGAGNSLLLMELSQANLEGVLLVLEHGADPWRRVPIGRAIGNTPPMMSMPFQLRNANANPFANEIAFRVARAGYYQGGTGAENLQLIWQMQQAIGAIYESLGREVPVDVTALLAMDVPESTG